MTENAIELRDGDPQITADALVVIRAAHLAERTGLTDPHARHFVTEAGRRMAELGQAIDPVYLPYNLARFRFFAERMAKAADQYRQILVLGCGYDTRPLWLPGFGGGRAQVFEVDFPETLESKAAILARQGIDLPRYVVPVGVSLDDPALPERLAAAGLLGAIPTAVFIEGVVFFLAPETTARLLDPRFIGLASRSTVTFDYWPAKRVDGLNGKMVAATGEKHFRAFPFADDPYGLSLALDALGYIAIAIVPVSTLAERLWLEEDPYSPHGDWRVVTAEVA